MSTKENYYDVFPSRNLSTHTKQVAAGLLLDRLLTHDRQFPRAQGSYGSRVSDRECRFFECWFLASAVMELTLMFISLHLQFQARPLKVIASTQYSTIETVLQYRCKAFSHCT